jgi:hypothetical protein
MPGWGGTLVGDHPMKLNGTLGTYFCWIGRGGGFGRWASRWRVYASAVGLLGGDWALYPGDFNGDSLGDLFLYRPNAGQYYVAVNTGSSHMSRAGLAG